MNKAILYLRQWAARNINSTRNITVIATCVIVFCALPASAQYSGLPGLSVAFLRDFRAAEEMVSQSKSAAPLLALQLRYTNVTEQAELEVSLGLVYSQRTGVVDYSKAVIHFTTALQYDLPEKTYIEILLWRGNAQELINKPKDALTDYLRGLLACSDYDLTGGWPEILSPKVMISLNDPDPENFERARDYNRYRRRLDFQRFLLMQRYSFIEAAKRVQPRVARSDGETIAILETLSPDSSRFRTITDWLKSENQRPLPCTPRPQTPLPAPPH